MERRRFLRAATAVGATGIATLSAGCGGGSDQPSRTPPTEGDIVMMSGDRESESNAAHWFDPVGLYVEPGETVIWANGTGFHSTAAFVTSGENFGVQAPERRIPEEAEPWYSGNLKDFGETVGWTFEVPGTYDYFCAEHRNFQQVGRIVVGEPGGPAQTPQTPYGFVPEAERIVDEGTVSFEEFDGARN
jgi:plastocyanin